MKIKTISIRGGGTYPHPEVRFANAKAEIEVTLEAEEGDVETVEQIREDYGSIISKEALLLAETLLTER